MRYLYLMAALALAASAQDVRIRGPWSLLESITTSNAAIIGDVVSGQSREDRNLVNVSARVKVVRALSGDLAAGTEVPVNWRFTVSADSLEAVDKVPPVHALWLLRRNGEAWEALRTEAMPTRFGGYFVVVPREPLPAELQYAADAPLRQKVAHELGWQMATLVTGAGSAGPQLGAAPGWLAAQDQVLSLHQTLGTLDFGSTRQVYKFFTAGEPALEVFGLAGRASKNDISSIYDLERDYPKLATADEGNVLPRALLSLNFVNDLPAAHALGRVAIAQNAIAALDIVYAYRIWMTRNKEFLPYMIAMLGSPDGQLRGAALFGVCQVVGKSPENSPYCFDTFRLKDEEIEKERAAVRYWNDWWEKHRAEIAKTVKLPEIQVPARYGGNPLEVTEAPSIKNLPGTVMSRLTPADRDAYRELARSHLLPGPLQEQLKQRLSPEGWNIIDTFLKESANDAPLLRFQK